MKVFSFDLLYATSMTSINAIMKLSKRELNKNILKQYFIKRKASRKLEPINKFVNL